MLAKDKIFRHKEINLTVMCHGHVPCLTNENVTFQEKINDEYEDLRMSLKNHALSTFYYAFYYKMISMEKHYLQTKSQNEGISYSFSNIHQ